MCNEYLPPVFGFCFPSLDNLIFFEEQQFYYNVVESVFPVLC